MLACSAFILLMYSRQRRCDVENPIIVVYKSVLSNASELLRCLSGQLPCVNALAKNVSFFCKFSTFIQM